MKRMFDLISSVLLFILLLPIFLGTAIVIALKMGRPVFFTQQRPGLNGDPFYLLKFRTMLNSTDREGNLLSDKQRLTHLGAWIRKYSLDELPQLLNVIKGDMSLVGPRPLLMEYLPLYSAEQKLRHLVRPGITGWAQVNGRNSVSWEEKFAMDTWYVNNRNAILDSRILLSTFIKVIKKEGITQSGHVTMEKFTGSKDVV
ncbi:sugar transferase [Jeotgalibacillus sp. S-D1]|uniref:sugar transferase n=1 Tax=Jeotgalibacillus sp. S-D1 TaxID=2552189 RepID=UPI00267C42EF|nr:sugar transferase [Jeotgalibacillus sp. S-D1]